MVVVMGCGECMGDVDARRAATLTCDQEGGLNWGLGRGPCSNTSRTQDLLQHRGSRRL